MAYFWTKAFDFFIAETFNTKEIRSKVSFQKMFQLSYIQNSFQFTFKNKWLVFFTFQSYELK